MTVGTDWVAFGGIAQLIAAVATVILAGITALMAKRTHDVVEETKKESKATQDLATEARTDRQLQWRPQLGLNDCWDEVTREGRNDRFYFSISNVGGGPAVGCKAMARLPWDVNTWSLWIVGDVESGAQAAHTEDAREGMSVYSAFEAPDAMAEPKRGPDVVLICSDILGRRYRFPIVDVFQDDEAARGLSNPREDWKPFPPDIYEEGSPDAPTWSGHPLLWSY